MPGFEAINLSNDNGYQPHEDLSGYYIYLVNTAQPQFLLVNDCAGSGLQRLQEVNSLPAEAASSASQEVSVPIAPWQRAEREAMRREAQRQKESRLPG